MIRALVVSAGLVAAGMLAGAVCAEAQSQQDVDQASVAHGATVKPKKVWTNDNMSEVSGTISVVGTPTPPRQTIAPSKISSLQQAMPTSPSKTQNAKASDGSVDPKMLAELKQAVQKLQTNIDQLDRQIDELKGASHGDSKNLGVLTSDPSRYSMEPVPDQIKALEAKKKSQQTLLDNLLDTARAVGIEPGQLR
jgi:septal ring factor EnvC (AmiA/AmiB activator)